MKNITEQRACSFEENLAYRKDTSQSSTYSDQGASGHAVDGNSNTQWNGRSCAHTALHEKQPWWRVDLGNVELVNEVYVVNRGDCCGFRLNPFEIRVGEKTFLVKTVNILLVSVHFPCRSRGKYVHWSDILCVFT